MSNKFNLDLNLLSLCWMLVLTTGCAWGGARVVSGEGDCTHIIQNGEYASSIGKLSFPAGSTVCAETDGQVVITGDFEPSGYNMRGIVVFGDRTKFVANGEFERMSFIGGPACGNTVNTVVGDDTVIRDSVFFGRGGRYLLLAYQVSGVRIENAIFRYDGGWGETDGCNEYEPNAALNFYDTSHAVCTGCINFDQNNTASQTSELLGGIGVNAHTEDRCFDVEISNSVDYNGSHFWAEGNGRCNPRFTRLNGNFNLHLRGTAEIRNSSGSICNTWRGDVVALDSQLGSGNCAVDNGDESAVELDRKFLDDPRWRRELCGGFSNRVDGWCASEVNLSDYINQ